MDDRLIGFMSTLKDKLDRVSEATQSIHHSHRATHQMLFSESRDKHATIQEHQTSALYPIFFWRGVRTILEEAQIEVHGDYVTSAENRPLLDPYMQRPADEVSLDANRESQVPLSMDHGGACGTLSQDRRTVETLLSSYLCHIHILHPFLDKNKLRNIMNAVMDARATELARDNPSLRNSSPMERTSRPKRMRLNNGTGLSDTYSVCHVSRLRGRFEKATAFMVLALGKICSHQDTLPKVFDYTLDAEPWALLVDLRGKPNQKKSSATVPCTSTFACAQDHEMPSSYDVHWTPGGNPASEPQSHSPAPKERNLDTIPGLAYYTAAMDVLGSEIEGSTLAHAQLFALAGLYKSQLARVRESMSWISKAGQIIRLLLQAEDLSDAVAPSFLFSDRINSMGGLEDREAYGDALQLMAWSIFQLESDILAEFRFPSSGLPALELVPYNIPKTSIANENLSGVRDHSQPHETVVLFYRAQCFLHMRLDSVRRDLYNNRATCTSRTQLQEMLREHDLILTQWRAQLPNELHWEDDEPPPSDILSARLRAKYWEVRYATRRPFLDLAMHILPYISSSVDVWQAVHDSNSAVRDVADIRLLEAIADMSSSEVSTAVKSCIDAAMQTAMAFDGVSHRPIETNMHGIAHAYVSAFIFVDSYAKTRVQPVRNSARSSRVV